MMSPLDYAVGAVIENKLPFYARRIGRDGRSHLVTHHCEQLLAAAVAMKSTSITSGPSLRQHTTLSGPIDKQQHAVASVNCARADVDEYEWMHATHLRMTTCAYCHGCTATRWSSGGPCGTAAVVRRCRSTGRRPGGTWSVRWLQHMYYGAHT